MNVKQAAEYLRNHLPPCWKLEIEDTDQDGATWAMTYPAELTLYRWSYGDDYGDNYGSDELFPANLVESVFDVYEILQRANEFTPPDVDVVANEPVADSFADADAFIEELKRKAR